MPFAISRSAIVFPSAFAPAILPPRVLSANVVFSDGSVLVLHRRVPRSLPGLAALVWQRSAEPTPVHRLVDAATSVMGGHPDAEALVLDTVAVLLDAGVVVAR